MKSHVIVLLGLDRLMCDIIYCIGNLYEKKKAMKMHDNGVGEEGGVVGRTVRMM